MKDYLLIIKTEGSVWTDLSPEQLQKHMENGSAYIGNLVKEGVLKGANPIEKTGSRIISGSGESLKDGPFNETKEVVAGYFVISAEDTTSAVQIAKENPIFNDINTQIEVHPLMPIGGN
ncbi:MAG: YciI family protein [Flavobacteriales bacterium]|nr:YciI family protein [Flavobacteriales bacterium]